MIELFDNAQVGYVLLAGISCQLDSVLLMAKREQKVMLVALGANSEAEAFWKA
ncbi:hypothetical protein [Pseudomonas sp. S1(2024)]|uniref:hypothetical protein n=1 Tax=Pseudomonas sp. S1(2024) TaxID=3390191 RepID=UPI00397D8F02